MAKLEAKILMMTVCTLVIAAVLVRPSTAQGALGGKTFTSADAALAYLKDMERKWATLSRPRYGKRMEPDEANQELYWTRR